MIKNRYGIIRFLLKEKKETLDKGLSKTKEGVFSKLARVVAGKSKVDDDSLDDLEEVLITSDVGVERLCVLSNGLKSESNGTNIFLPGAEGNVA